jgi:competence protein ComEC
MAFGIAVVAWLPHLPSLSFLSICTACVAVTARWYRHRWWGWLLALLLGLGWGSAFGYHTRAELLPVALEQQSLLLEGRIVGLVEQSTGFAEKPVLRFRFAVDRCETAPGTACVATPRRVQLSWYETDIEPASGERWRLRAKLKRPRGFANPGGFDYEAWLVANRIGGVGYIERSRDDVRIQPASSWSVDGWRARARDYLQRRLHAAQHRDLLLGLLVGDGSAIGPAAWDTFRATGTVHLFVVSGLQIAFSGGLALWFSRLWWRSPLAVSTRRSGWLGALPALLVAVAYALLAGMGLPIQRALIMFAIFLWTLTARREVRASSGWVMALWLALLCDPLAVLDVGFWFSFIAVGALLMAVAGQRAPHRARWWRAQYAIFAASLPVLLALSGQFTWLSLPANLLAIPLSTFVSMPLAFLAVIADGISTGVGDHLWQWSDRTLDWLCIYLQWLQQHGAAAIWHAAGVNALSIACAAVFALLTLLPRGIPGRALALCFLLPLFFPRLDTIAQGASRVTVIDVGQGLSVLVETAEHRLLYDTGPPFGPERSVAELTVTPLLHQRGIKNLDAVVVSHRDNDHAGGWPELAQQFGVSRLLVGERIGDMRSEYCRAGMHWQWDGVDFDMLYPDSTDASGNNASCVLQIRSGGSTILLTGDIERSAESALLANPQLQPITLLLAPHHGSKSSSTAAFVARTRPHHVVFSCGYRNRFRHPHPDVEQRYRASGAALYNTALDGALLFDFDERGVQQITRQRSQLRHYWD